MAMLTSMMRDTPRSDEYSTPSHILDQVLNLLDPGVHELWEPFRGDGISTAHMRSRGFHVHNGDNPDFFLQTAVPAPADTTKTVIMVTNPPFSKKREILRDIVYKFSDLRSFALLLPSGSLFTKDYRELIANVAWAGIFSLNTKFLVGGKPVKYSSFNTLWLLVGPVFASSIDNNNHGHEEGENDGEEGEDQKPAVPFIAKACAVDAMRRFSTRPDTICPAARYVLTLPLRDAYDFDKRNEFTKRMRARYTRDSYYPPLEPMVHLVQHTTADHYIPVLPGTPDPVLRYFSSEPVLDALRRRRDRRAATYSPLVVIDPPKNSSSCCARRPSVMYVLMTSAPDLEENLKEFLESLVQDPDSRATDTDYFLALFINDMMISSTILNYVIWRCHPSGGRAYRSWFLPMRRFKFRETLTGNACKAEGPFGTLWRIMEL
jgi:hypothetical protein